jgi:hypothetical protein
VVILFDSGSVTAVVTAVDDPIFTTSVL